jgi:hypothetical protein
MSRRPISRSANRLEWYWYGAGPDQEMNHMAINPTVSPELLEDHYQKDWSREVITDEYYSINSGSYDE